ncbi:MAG: serine/threonine protein kinase [Myxococcales bacterium]|nr:MAG: serine/threonine protein kinase [Myxococcales bacterium]
MQVKHFGRYELLRKVAMGGMAEIFIALQRGRSGFKKEVIVKRLFRHLADDKRVLQLFKNEAQLLASLDHPGIPQVYDFGIADGQWYMVMERVRGFSVAELVDVLHQQQKALPLESALSVVIQAADALHFAHENGSVLGGASGIVHRDVTPQNLMLGRHGHLKVLDFGVAQTSEGTGTQSGVVTGTYAYMPPEQIQGRRLDRRADVFALGVVLFELATHTRLFPGTDLEVMTAVVEQDAPRPSERVANFDPDLEAILMASLERERMKRTQHARLLADQLEEFAAKKGYVVTPVRVSRFLKSVSEWLPDDDTRFEKLAPGQILDGFGDGTGSGSGSESIQSFDDESLLEDIKLLSSPLGSASSRPLAVKERTERSNRFPYDALSVDLGEARGDKDRDPES